MRNGREKGSEAERVRKAGGERGRQRWSKGGWVRRMGVEKVCVCEREREREKREGERGRESGRVREGEKGKREEEGVERENFNCTSKNCIQHLELQGQG